MRSQLGVGEPAVVVEKEHHVAAARVHSCVAAPCHTKIFRKFDHLDTRWHRAHVGAVPDGNHFQAVPLLCQCTADGPRQLGRPVPHREDHARELHPVTAAAGT